MKKLVLVLLLALTQLAAATADSSVDSTLESDMELKTVNGDTVTIPHEGPAHLVFIDNWVSYGGHGPEAAVAALPDAFHQRVPTIWLQPRLNVTHDHLLEYQKAFPASTPLVMDDHLQIMRKFSVQNTPSHVLLQDGKVVFSGTTQAFLNHLGYGQIAETVAESTAENGTENLGDNASEGSPDPVPSVKVPSVKDIANLDEFLFSSDDTAYLIFLDDLCPTDHMPGCEETVEEISQSYRAGEHNWIVIYNSFYSDQSTNKAFSEKHNLTMPALFDEDHAIFDRYKVYSTPYFIQLKRNGNIMGRGSDVSLLTRQSRRPD